MVYGLSLVLIRPALILFTDADSPVYAITLEGFPLFAISFLLMGIGIFTSSLFTAFSNGLVSAVVSFAPALILFTDADSPVYAITLEGFPLFAISFLLMGIGIFTSSLFTAFSNGLVSAVVSFARTFVFLVGMLLLLPRVWGEAGIWLATPVAEGLGLAVCAAFLVWGRRKYHY